VYSGTYREVAFVAMGSTVGLLSQRERDLRLGMKRQLPDMEYGEYIEYIVGGSREGVILQLRR
jgi:hypothetical protein